MISRSLLYSSLVLGGVFSLTTGCSILGHHDAEEVQNAPPSSAPNREQDLRSQIIELQKAQTKQNEQIAELNNKLLLMKDRIDGPGTLKAEKPSAPAPTQAKSTSPVNPLAVQPAPINLPEPKTNKGLTVESLYTRFLVDSKKTPLAEAQKDVEEMLRLYKNSPLTSNALYGYGSILYDRAKYSESAAEFERLYKVFPDGNKAVSALYKLALCYQKTGHPQEAQEAFQNVVTVYPGSREALEAEKQIVGGGEQ